MRGLKKDSLPDLKNKKLLSKLKAASFKKLS